jgi:hypothetical protein
MSLAKTVVGAVTLNTADSSAIANNDFFIDISFKYFKLVLVCF